VRGRLSIRGLKWTEYQKAGARLMNGHQQQLGARATGLPGETFCGSEGFRSSKYWAGARLMGGRQLGASMNYWGAYERGCRGNQATWRIQSTPEITRPSSIRVAWLSCTKQASD
jgi:hypothetical protein